MAQSLKLSYVRIGVKQESVTMEKNANLPMEGMS
jgi:hypothetical protein